MLAELLNTLTTPNIAVILLLRASPRPRFQIHRAIPSVQQPQFAFGDCNVSAVAVVAHNATVTQWIARAAHKFCMRDKPHVCPVFKLIWCESVELYGGLALVQALQPAKPPEQSEHVRIYCNERLTPNKSHHDVGALAAHLPHISITGW
jgi:hypothetical protein